MKSLIANKQISAASKIVFVNDGSKDTTWNIIQSLHEKDSIFSGINLISNRGHQNALLAGLMTVKDFADMAISMDADLQDDIDAIDAMIEQYEQGADIVYGVRSKRVSDAFFKRFTAEAFYRFVNALGGKAIFNHADYRLMSKRALNGLAHFKEVNLFLRGIVPMIGYNSSIVTYERAERFAGVSKYPLKKMFSFALEGILSLSTKPLRAISFCGIFAIIISLCIFITILAQCIGGNEITISLWLMFSIWCIGGLILLCMRILGGYIGKVYMEVKARPRFIVEQFLQRYDEKGE